MPKKSAALRSGAFWMGKEFLKIVRILPLSGNHMAGLNALTLAQIML